MRISTSFCSDGLDPRVNLRQRSTSTTKSTNGRNALLRSGWVSSCLVIEVKSHDQHGIKYETGHLFVTYPEGLEDTTEKNFEQVHSLRNYLMKRRMNPPFTVGLIWLSSIPAPHLPPQPHNLLGSKFNWDHSRQCGGRKNAPKFYEGRWNLTAQNLNNPVAFPRLLKTHICDGADLRPGQGTHGPHRQGGRPGGVAEPPRSQDVRSSGAGRDRENRIASACSLGKHTTRPMPGC